MDKKLADLSDWANISHDVLRCIADLTRSVKDYLCMTAVCQPWQASLKDLKLKFPACLMLEETDKSDKHCFYNTSEEIFVELDLPEIRGKRCWGSPFGWLVTFGFGIEFKLFNPLSRASIGLPSWRRLPTLPNYLEELILLTSPDDSISDCIVMAIYSPDRWLAFAKPGNQEWTMIGGIRSVNDVIYFKGNIYACTRAGEIFLCQDLDRAHPKVLKFASQPNARATAWKYLFDLDGNLCMASPKIFSFSCADVNPCSMFTDEIVIFKLDMQTSIWEKIYSLGDNSLFLGNCSSFTIAAADYPGCRPNCIYLTYKHPGYDNEERTYADHASIYDCKNLSLYLDYKTKLDCVELEPFPNSKVMQHVLRLLWIIPYSR